MMTASNALPRARTTHLCARLLDLSNVPAVVVDRTADDLAADIATGAVFMVTEYGSLARAGDYLDKATQRALAAGDTRPVALAYGSPRAGGRVEPLAVLTVADLGRLLARIADAEEQVVAA